MPFNYSNISLTSLRNPVLIAVWVLIAVVSKSGAPWVFWLSMVALPALVIWQQEKNYLLSFAGKRVLWISLILLVAHFLWAVIRSFYYDASQPGTYWHDDHQYFYQSAAIAKAWKSGDYPQIWLYGSLPYLGTLHTGYHRPLATLFMVFGPGTLAGLFLNAVCAACLPLLAALSARLLWETDLDNLENLYYKEIGVIAAFLTAFHPTQFYWASFLMKDLYLTFVFLASLIMVLGSFRRRNGAYAIASLLMFPYLFTVRAYAAIALFLSAALLSVSRFSRKIITRVAGVGVLFGYLMCAYTVRGSRFFEQLLDSLHALIPKHLDKPADLLLQMVTGIPRLFLSPYAWLKLEGQSGMYGMYPGMWYLYLVGYPLGFAGLYAAIRRDVKPAIVPLAVFGLTALIFLAAVYEGDASRQRYFLEYLVLLFAAYGWQNPSRSWIIGIIVLEAAFAIGQLISLQ